jgi:hypothetical protein
VGDVDLSQIAGQLVRTKTNIFFPTYIQRSIPAALILAIIPKIAPQRLKHSRDRGIHVWYSSEMRDRRCDEAVQLGPVVDAAGLEVKCGFWE